MPGRVLREKLLYLVETLDHRFDRLKLYLKLRYGWLGPVRILPYRGHGTERVLHLTGRVMEEKEIWLPAIDDSVWRNLRAMIRRFVGAEVPGARVRVRRGGAERVVIADDEGFFDARIETRGTLPADGAWRRVDLDLVWPMARGQKGARAAGEAFVPRGGARGAAFGVISDVDDTIVRTGATSVLMTLRLVLFSNAHTRLPFEGVAAFYRALRAGGDGGRDNPVFYVSTGPWNLYDLISDFLDLQDIPAGPIFLKDWAGLKDLLRGTDHRAHKLGVIRGILAEHPDLPFVLVGDSGQQDAETYAQVAREHPGRVLAVYIRDVNHRSAERDRAVREVAAEMRALSVPMLLVEDTVAAAEHAASRGLISPASLPGIRADKEEDAEGFTLRGVSYHGATGPGKGGEA